MRIDNTFKIDFIPLNEFRRIQIQFATNRIKIGLLEPEIQPSKCCATSLRNAFDVMGQPPVAIRCVIIFVLFLTVDVHLQDTQDISEAQLPYRHIERSMFVVYSSARDSRGLCYYPISCKVAFFSPLKIFTGCNFEARTLRFSPF